MYSLFDRISAVADLGGVVPHPQRDSILLISHMFLLKSTRVGGRLLPPPHQWEILDPQLIRIVIRRQWSDHQR